MRQARILPEAATARFRACLIAIRLAVAFFGGVNEAAALAQEPIRVRREILALYDGAQEGSADATRIHRFAELPLNHLGFILRFHDIRTSLPDPTGIERYQGVLTWFAGPVADPTSYLGWASRVARRNVRYVILGDVGIAIDSANIEAVNRLLALAGVRHTGDYVSPTLGTRAANVDARLIGFECRLDPVLPDYPVMTAVSAQTRTELVLQTPSYDGRRKSVPVAIGEKGGYAAPNYEMCPQRAPLYRGQWLINPFEFFRAAFGCDDGPVPDTTTASGNRLFFSVLESEGLTRTSRIEGFLDDSTFAGDVVVRELIQPFHDLPTTFALQGDEQAKSAKRGTQTAMLVQRIEANANIDLLARVLRGALSRFDAEYPSISNLQPLTSADSDRAINKPMSDETAYGRQGAVGEYGFSALDQTLAGTESPRRLGPFNVNYHGYCGEYPSLLRSVRAQLTAARLADLTPISANRYADIVSGFLSARIDRLGDKLWRIADRGALQTIRFDGVENLEVNYRSSQGVVGAKRRGATLYVALDEAVEPAVLALGPPQSISAVGGLGLVESRWLVRAVRKHACDLHFEAQGYGDGSFTWSGASGRYAVTIDRAGEKLWGGQAEADNSGRLSFVVPVAATDPVQVAVECVTDAHLTQH